ncbi:hypothetical protein ACFSUD_19040 [Sulfitobacter aestuarii]|uniref:Uncharacterized protein n=1 Tax=Sulfitobacter aestuarii TaxID=2161676 RepID=A0ABW5U6W2_9RHOB
MTTFAICGPVRHTSYVIARLQRQGVDAKNIRAVLTISDMGNNARTEVGFNDRDVHVTWTEDSRSLLREHINESEALSSKSPTPIHAIFNMFYQNSQVAAQITDDPEIIGRLRSDILFYDDCVKRLQSGECGLAWNPVAVESHYISDQFMAFPRKAYAQIWATEGFAASFTDAKGIPESIIRDRAQAIFGSGANDFAFSRFVDFDIVYENARWADTPRMFWIKKRFGWQACYAATGRKSALVKAFDRLHSRTLGSTSLLRKSANLLLKIAYLPVFLTEMSGIGRDARIFPTHKAASEQPK